MRRRPAILLLFAIALLLPACGDDDGGPTIGPGGDGGVPPINSGTPTGRQGSSPVGTW